MDIKKILFLLLIPLYIKTEQFIYPVASLDHAGEEILLVYQKSLDDIELWIWNSTTKTAIKGLLSAYIPAGIKMLPSGAGFSFIDEGRLRVKNFYKRLPKTIAMYQPISKITEIHWISDDAFYFSAKEGNAYNIFSSNTIGEVQRCTSGQDLDYMYPSKVGESVYCIERDKIRSTFKIVKTPWELCAYECENRILQSKEVLFSTDQPISYLYMASDCEGFYLDYSSISLGAIEETLLFSCCRIYKNDSDDWATEKLFEFKIPSLYVIGKEKKRLYESVAPFLPRYENSSVVYFVDADSKSGLKLKQYDIKHHVCKSLSSQIGGGFNDLQCISPLVVDQYVYTGFIVDEYQNPDCVVDIDGSLFIELPRLSLK